MPYIDRNMDMKTIIWDTIHIGGGSEEITSKAAKKKMLQNEAIITAWAPALLLMELDNLLWKDAENISIKKLWGYLCTYCYLPLTAVDGAQVEISLEVDVKSPDGLSQQTVRTVSENCRTLGVQFGFDE